MLRPLSPVRDQGIVDKSILKIETLLTGADIGAVIFVKVKRAAIEPVFRGVAI
jgi:hypothetical protein